jgi:hypothetical protein
VGTALCGQSDAIGQRISYGLNVLQDSTGIPVKKLNQIFKPKESYPDSMLVLQAIGTLDRRIAF